MSIDQFNFDTMYNNILFGLVYWMTFSMTFRTEIKWRFRTMCFKRSDLSFSLLIKYDFETKILHDRAWSR